MTAHFTRPRRRATGLAAGTAIAIGLASLLLSACGHGDDASPGAVCAPLSAADLHEPPCNPALASRIWSGPHRNSYAQGSSPLPGPVTGAGLRYRRTADVPQIATIFSISEPYPDGRHTLWFSTTSSPQRYAIYKLDYDTLQVLGRRDIGDEGGQGQLTPTTSGVYNVLLRGNRLVALRERSIGVYADAVPGERTSDIALVHRFDLPDTAFCRGTDRIAGVVALYSGEIAFATAQGVLGVVPAEPARMDAAHLLLHSINGARCNDPAVADDALEQITNSIAADEHGGIYPVSSHAMYKFQFDGRAIRQAWRAAYQTGGGTGGTTLGPGSGSTPSLMGTRPHDDRFVVITDGQALMHLVLFWRDEIPPDWTPIAPGRDPRIACEVPVTFGDPDATRSISEQSVLVRGYAAVVVNNALRLDPLFNLLPDLGFNQIAALTGQLPFNQPRGVERIDWDPVARQCRVVWANREASIPNGVPTMSAASRMVYGIGARDGVWGLLGLDFDTGAERFFVPSSALPSDNSFFAAATVGPGGDIVTGLFRGIGIFSARDAR